MSIDLLVICIERLLPFILALVVQFSGPSQAVSPASRSRRHGGAPLQADQEYGPWHWCRAG